MVRTFRICRERKTSAGTATSPVGLPAMGIDALSITAPNADEALARAKQLVPDNRNLVAIPTEN